MVAATIIDCNGTEAEPHRGFFFQGGEDSNSVLAGFTITNAYADSGGGILCLGSSPLIEKCVVSKNSAIEGGGLLNFDNSPTVKHCVFRDNQAYYGGAIYNVNSSRATLKNCLLVGNSAVWSGGGLYNEGEAGLENRATLSNCTLVENSAAQGGAIYNSGQDTTDLTNCIVWVNEPDSIDAEPNPVFPTESDAENNAIITDAIIKAKCLFLFILCVLEQLLLLL